MNDFDRRWHALVAASRSAPSSTAEMREPLDPARAQGLAERALGHRERQMRQRKELRAMTLAAGACLAWLPLATALPSLAALTGVAAICVALVGYEALRA